MGIRGEIFSTRLILPNRTYFLNVKENRMGDLYLNIVESKNKESGGFERQSVIIFAEDLPAFLGEFDKSLKVLEKAAREQKKSGRESSRPRQDTESRDPHTPGDRPRNRDRPDGESRSRHTPGDRPRNRDRPDGESRSRHSPGDRPQNKVRRVTTKRERPKP